MSLHEEKQCSLCGHPGPFAPFFTGASLRETRCPGCAASRRTRDVARVLLRECLPEAAHLPGLDLEKATLADSLERLRPFRIYELQAQGPLHSLLRLLPQYACSEYLRNIKPGHRNEAGVLCQDASCLTFPDASFDIVISQDVLEHMEDPWRGFAEIRRVLRPGGRHIFTVPLHEGQKTRCRATRPTAATDVRHILPPVYHKDMLDKNGALVFWDYGDDLPELLAAGGFFVRKAAHARFYPPEKICNVNDGEAHARCLQACENKRQVSFFLYNSVVFVAENQPG